MIQSRKLVYGIVSCQHTIWCITLDINYVPRRFFLALFIGCASATATVIRTEQSDFSGS